MSLNVAYNSVSTVGRIGVDTEEQENAYEVIDMDKNIDTDNNVDYEYNAAYSVVPSSPVVLTLDGYSKLQDSVPLRSPVAVTADGYSLIQENASDGGVGGKKPAPPPLPEGYSQLHPVMGAGQEGRKEAEETGHYDVPEAVEPDKYSHLDF